MIHSHNIVLLSLLTACGGDNVSAYCAKVGECYAAEDCPHGAEVCDALGEGEKRACEADVIAYETAIRSANLPACDICLDSLDAYLNCVGGIATCSDFWQASEEDCDGEFEEYIKDCDNIDSLCLETNGNNPSAGDTG